MSKRGQTQLALEAALERVKNGQTRRISASRKLSARAVEEEAGLGNGSCYYYPEIIERIRRAKFHVSAITHSASFPDVQNLRQRYQNEKRIKERYKQEKVDLKNLVARMATEHHHLNDALRKALLTIGELEKENSALREKVTDSLRNTLHVIRDDDHS
ncbi:hypothetical protein EKN38_25190 [Enterobacter sp. WCHEn045836]|uniref:hypothetical protein n=1 Tax=Enterobacter sp. WCHEn045836 TaxID=2497434 RepID=UPI000F849DDB|nr:hypothetical protein [Enterobacter sp. WCHEn045836]RTP93723.1 hypothetical protein EKN38_25190 [Enterobacter sp. WCHEn045836]